jgi:hypothetical protein
MSPLFEFPDSEVRDVAVDGDVVRVRFSAAAVQGDHGVRGWLPGVTLQLSGATLEGKVAHAFGRIVEGQVLHDGRSLSRLAVPCALSGALELLLRFANGALVNVSGGAVELSSTPGAAFAEDLSC